MSTWKLEDEGSQRIPLFPQHLSLLSSYLQFYGRKHGHTYARQTPIASTRDHRTSCVWLLCPRHVFHCLHFHQLSRLSKTHQPIDILCVMGQYSLQHSYTHGTKWHTRRKGLSSLPISGLSDPNVFVAVSPSLHTLTIPTGFCPLTHYGTLLWPSMST